MMDVIMEKCISCGGELPSTQPEGKRRWREAICPACAEWVGAAGMFLPDDTSLARKNTEEPGDCAEEDPKH